MTLDQRLAQAAHQMADGLTPPEVDLDAVRSKARAHRRRAVVLAVSAVVLAVVAAGAAVVSVRDTSAPTPPVGPPRPSTSVGVETPAWLGDMPIGAPPLTPYSRDGVLQVDGVEVETPFPVDRIEVAGETVMVGQQSGVSGGAQWALVRDGGLELLPASVEWPQLNADGRIAFWESKSDPGTTRFVAWDTETNTELASRTVLGTSDENNRLQMVGVDSDGIAYWVDQSSDPPVVRWDVRANTVEPTDVPFDFSKTFEDQAAPIPDLWVGLEDAYVSPDGSQELFTGSAPGDSPQDCCKTRLRLRPVGPIESVDPTDVVTLQLPEGVPPMRLWDAYSDRGTWGAWWESNETVLLDAFRLGHSYLVRCSAVDGACELVFDLGSNSSKGILYMPDWERDTTFARFPVSE